MKNTSGICFSYLFTAVGPIGPISKHSGGTCKSPTRRLCVLVCVVFLLVCGVDDIK